MLATQAMTVDATRQDHSSNFDQLHNWSSGLWPEIPSRNLDSLSMHNTYSQQFDLVTQMAFQANMAPEFSDKTTVLYPQSFQHGQEWTGSRGLCRPQSQSSPCSSPLQSQPSLMNEKPGYDHETEISQLRCQRQRGGNYAEYTSSNTSARGQPSPSGSFPVERLRHQSSVDFGEDLLRNSHDTVNENIFADWCWGSRERAGKRPVDEDSAQWERDAGFVSPRDSLTCSSSDKVDSRWFPHVKVSDKEKSRLRTLSLNQVSKPKSGPPSSLGKHPSAWPVLRTRTGSIDPDVVSTYRALSLEYLGSSMHERKPLATVGPRREKLTEQQKRRNHILHEKKRRALIKEGFDDLLNLVPDVKDRGLSKSAILLKAAEWLGTLMCDNKALRAQARALEGADSMVRPPRPASRHQRSH